MSEVIQKDTSKILTVGKVKKLDDTTGKLKGKKAKKDHHLKQNHIDIKIKKDQDLKDIPDRFIGALESENVI